MSLLGQRWAEGVFLGGWVSHVVWGQPCLEVSAFVQISSSVKNGGRPEALCIIPLLQQIIPQNKQTFERGNTLTFGWIVGSCHSHEQATVTDTNWAMVPEFKGSQDSQTYEWKKHNFLSGSTT